MVLLVSRLIVALLVLDLISANNSYDNSILEDPSYDNLLKCMWDGNTVATCHQVPDLGCVWCHSAHSNICVTKEYAENLDGSVFRCETHTADDDATTDDATNDDATSDDDLVNDDDDPNHEANEKYFDHLSQCMNGYDNPMDCNGSDLSFHCQWCYDSTPSGICFSKQAAKNVDGSYFDCSSRNSLDDDDFNNYWTAADS